MLNFAVKNSERYTPSVLGAQLYKGEGLYYLNSCKHVALDVFSKMEVASHLSGVSYSSSG